MKQLKVILILLFLIQTKIFCQTYASPPGPENVLVVYNSLDQISNEVKNYYIEMRGIPESNVVSLDGLEDVNLTYENSTHHIAIVQSGDILRDETQSAIDSVTEEGGTFHAWQYFYERIAIPIKQHLENTFVNGKKLKETIRYIVLCKGIPPKLQSRYDVSGVGYPEYYNVSLQNLLCILNNEPYYDILKTFFSNGGGGLRTNAYYTLFPQILNMNYRFLPDFFTNSNGLKISYLVSRLDGLTYADVRNSIYNSFNSDKTGLSTWIIDGYSQLGYVPPSAAKHLQDLGFQVNCNFDEEYILDNHLYNNNEVIGVDSV